MLNFNKIIFYISFLFFSFLFSCKKKISINGLDSQSFKSDRQACNGFREKVGKDFNSIRLQLKSLTQSEIVELLGRPDFQVLETHGQKYYVYFMEKGNQCINKDDPNKTKTLVLHFNAVELVSEASIEIGKPIN